jgi:hypothetical protein
VFARLPSFLLDFSSVNSKFRIASSLSLQRIRCLKQASARPATVSAARWSPPISTPLYGSSPSQSEGSKKAVKILGRLGRDHLERLTPGRGPAGTLATDL